MRPLPLRHIDHPVLRLPDLERRVGFDGEVPGCAADKRREDPGLAQLRGCGVEPHGPVVGSFGAEGAGPLPYLSDPDGNVVGPKGPAAAN